METYLLKALLMGLGFVVFPFALIGAAAGILSLLDRFGHFLAGHVHLHSR
jgi:hypothetical protein